MHAFDFAVPLRAHLAAALHPQLLTPLDDEPMLQRMQLEALQDARHGTLDGRAVLHSLLAVRHLWTSCLVDGEEHVDTLYLLCTTREHAVKLLQMHHLWRADSAQLIPPESTSHLNLDDDGKHWLVVMSWS